MNFVQCFYKVGNIGEDTTPMPKWYKNKEKKQI